MKELHSDQVPPAAAPTAPPGDLHTNKLELYLSCRVDVVGTGDAATQGYWSVPIGQVQLRQATGSSSTAAGVCSSSGGSDRCIGILDSGTTQLSASLDQVSLERVQHVTVLDSDRTSSIHRVTCHSGPAWLLYGGCNVACKVILHRSPPLYQNCAPLLLQVLLP